MTYSAGNLIVNTDYNGFASTNSGANVNDLWGTGSGDKGYGQSSVLTTVSTGTSITAPQWSNLNTRITSIANHQSTTITSRTNPVTGTLVQILSNLNTDLTNCTTRRGFAAASGTTSSTWSGNSAKTTTTGSGNAAWTITWTHTLSFGSADQARYFWNAGGLVRLDMSKTGNVLDSDPDWNSFISTIGTIYFSGRVAGAAQTIAGVSYTGTQKVGGSGSATVASTTGWYSLTPGAAATQIFLQYDINSVYTGDYVQVYAAVNAGSTAITFTTYWVSTARTGAGQNTQISGGTDTVSPFSTFGTAPAVIARFIPPSTTYLTQTWGSPAIAATVA